ncbi:hypothetical protein GCM10010112_56900 [Actinoplanes lobatus]|uniref:Uncharacterized protein n=1 Tax=Actinoplanes lobatus TaxID=113568 RepID=A0A7W7MF80_9ACTN|nr:hypothetical protein [Actinoplanes lobatus]MBB4747991.1 hypothetical protein [Actinoplanes lobatus]GGN80927.1 hypothetical protein GCM10010112_56900 [Actinoplanes lobatus]GIE41542.1 hypothetical protein Alo02nite_44400 [Actinoplanes lobatus]
MPRLPDDDGYEPPLKVLRKRLNGVYREDLGFSGPTRRYLLMVALLVGLASLPTLAVLTAGRSEITGTNRPGAMDVPFLPPPASGPVRPFPPPSVEAPIKPQTDQGYGQSTRPGKSGTPSRPAASRHPSSPSSPASPNAARVFPPSAPRAGAVPSRVAVPARPARPKRVQPRRMARSAPGGIPTVPELPAVPAEDEVPKSSRPSLFPFVPGRATPSPRAAPDEPDRGSSDHDEPPCPDHGSFTVHDSRSPDRPRHRRRSAMTDHNHNIRSSRILEQSYSGGNSSAVRRRLNDSNSEENRLANRPYRGQHRAEHTNYPEERRSDRSSRVGRHHAERAPDHYKNRR